MRQKTPRFPMSLVETLVAALLVLLLPQPGASGGFTWPQFGLDSQHGGNNRAENVLAAGNVAGLVPLFQVTLPSIADGAPAFLSQVRTPAGVRNLVYLTTKDGSILARDANSGTAVWSQRPATVPQYTTSSPAVDPGRQYVYSYGLDGWVHKYAAGSGAEVTSGGWPQLATLKPDVEKGSSALALATAKNGVSYLYAANGGYPGDAGDYQGHVTTINLVTGSQNVFNAACSNEAVHFLEAPASPSCPFVQNAIWARVGVVYDGTTDRIFMATGNGVFDGNAGGHGWGDTVFALRPDGTGSAGLPLDSYTPAEFQHLQDVDADLGSTAPAILPAPGFAGVLALQSGKDAVLRLVDLSDLSGLGGPGHVGGELQKVAVPRGGGVLTAPAVWVNPADGAAWAFVANGAGIAGLKLTVTGGVPSLGTQWSNPSGGTSPILANNVLYYAGPGLVRALDPATGSLLWSGVIGGIHWESPIVANGVLFVTDESSHLTAFALPGTATTTADLAITNSHGGTPYAPSAPITYSIIVSSAGPAAASATVSAGFPASLAGVTWSCLPSSGGTCGSGTGNLSDAIFLPAGATASYTVHASVAPSASGPIVVTATVAPSGGLTDPDPSNNTAIDQAPPANTGLPSSFFTLPPCRAVDTRNADGPNGGPPLDAGQVRMFSLGGVCGVPPEARAVAANVTIVRPSSAGSLTLFPSDIPLPGTSTMSARPGQVRANNAVLSLSAAGQVSAYCGIPSGQADVLIDVSGYFR